MATGLPARPSEAMPVITLTTDFGAQDSFVGVMKGVMLRINQEAVFVDLTHQIAPQNVRQAAYVIATSFSYFPEGSIHLCVVDPGVGSKRRPIVVEAGGHYFVGPDNGLFTKIIRNVPPARIHEITNRDFLEQETSHTFHGRDIFAPVAAWLSRGGVPLEAVGPEVKDPVLLDLPRQSQPAANLVEGEVIYIDGFGNAITNITRAMLEKVATDVGAAGMEINHKAGPVNGLLQAYGAAPDETGLCATIGSWNTVEIFVNNGNAAYAHGLSVGDNVEVRFY